MDSILRDQARGCVPAGMRSGGVAMKRSQSVLAAGSFMLSLARGEDKGKKRKKGLLRSGTPSPGAECPVRHLKLRMR